MHGQLTRARQHASAGAVVAARVQPHQFGRAAAAALYHELALSPKPGLVSFVDSGSHEDMDATTFIRSIFALRGYFPAMVEAGARSAAMAELQAAGLRAEARMEAATGGVNTHRGAIFTLGLLCAAAGRISTRQGAFTAGELRESLRQAWGDALHRRAQLAATRPATTHGQVVARAHGLRSAGEEAAQGFPVLFTTTLPVLRATRRVSSAQGAMVQALLATIAVLDDTNLAHRGGLAGLCFAQEQARLFLARGGVLHPGWREHADHVHRAFVRARLSPGGAADLLACAWWLDRVTCPG